VVVPIVEGAGVSLRLSRLRDIATPVPKTFGVPGPIGRGIPARGTGARAIVLPMPGFDRRGARTGSAAGHSGRFLRKHPRTEKRGTAFGCEKIDPPLQIDENDLRMDRIVAGEDLVFPGGGRRTGKGCVGRPPCFLWK